MEKIIGRLVNYETDIVMFCCTTISQREIVLCNNSRVSYCDWLQSYSVMLWPWRYGLVCTDAACYTLPQDLAVFPVYGHSLGQLQKPGAGVEITEGQIKLCVCVWVEEGCTSEGVWWRDKQRMINWLLWWEQEKDCRISVSLICMYTNIYFYLTFKQDMDEHTTYRPS